MDSDLYRCTDMALITYLKLKGHQVQGVEWDTPTESVTWTFQRMPSLIAAVDEFNSGEALVEPREYNRVFQLTKREMYSERDPHSRR